MSLKEVLEGLNKFSEDFFDCEVLFEYLDENGKRAFKSVNSINYAGNTKNIIFADKETTDLLLKKKIRILKKGEKL
jgi:hypothetical protein